MIDSFDSKVMAFTIDMFQSDYSSVWALAEFMHPIALALMSGNAQASHAVTALAAEIDLADVNLHLLSILNSLERAIVEGRLDLIWIQ